METLSLKTPVGELTLFADNDALIALSWGQGMDAPRSTKSTVLNQAAALLKDYFKTGAADFSTLKINPSGTPFQKRAWTALRKIKSGKTRSYGQLAATLKGGARAMGGACAANPLPIIVPCHRVLAKDGKVGNYSGGEGAKTKDFLLRLEGVDL